MDYEKRYKEALKKAKSIYRDAKEVGCSHTDWLEHIFPELAESEDERIREELVGGLMWLRDNLDRLGDHSNDLILPGFTMNVGTLLAWLERQKEEEGYEIIPVESTLEYKLGFNAGKESVKQKEQKPVEYLDKEKVFGIMNKLHQLGYSALIPVDSEEYKKIDEITSDVRDLLDYPIKQKPAEWSEEDEAIRHKVIAELEWGRRNTTVDKDIRQYDRMLNWLKSLRPQPHWKPTEKQMNNLEFAFNLPELDGWGNLKDTLEDLYNDLKKL